jgi:hypothetical protein
MLAQASMGWYEYPAVALATVGAPKGRARAYMGA